MYLHKTQQIRIFVIVIWLTKLHYDSNKREYFLCILTIVQAFKIIICKLSL